TIYVFFPAEDGIRGYHVTGVQTCALPISPIVGEGWRVSAELSRTGFFGVIFASKKEFGDVVGVMAHVCGHGLLRGRWREALWMRSEERRVGRGCEAGRGG